MDYSWALPLIVVQGYFVAFLFMAVHETAHKTAFRGRAPQSCGGPSLGLHDRACRYEYYCLFHWDHHRYTQDPEKDPELIVGPKPTSDTQLAIAYSGLLQLAGRVRLMLRHALTGKVALPWIPENKRHHHRARSAPLCRGSMSLLLLALACACTPQFCSGSGSFPC